jgi:hypothetical protein
VLERLRRGDTNPEIARGLGMSVDGVKFHVSNLLLRLDLASRAELAAWRGGEGEPVTRSGVGEIPRHDRAVQFPRDAAIGELFLRDWGAADRPEPYWEVRHRFGHWEALGPARGVATVPAGHELGLRVAEGLADHPALAALGPDDVQVMVKIGEPPIAPVAHLSGLRQLVAGGMNALEDEALAPSKGLASLHHLLLAGRGRIDRGLAPLARHARLRELTLVDFAGIELTPAAFADLARTDSLRRLDLVGVQPTREGLEELARAKRLEVLRVTGLRAEDADHRLEPIAALAIPALSLEAGAHVGDATLQRLARAYGPGRPLLRIELQGTRVTDVGLESLFEAIPIGEMQALWLGGTGATAAVLQAIEQMAALRELDLRGLAIGDSDLASLRGLARLAHLNLARTRITDRAANALAALPALRTLSLEETALSESAVAALRERLPECDVVHSQRDWLLSGARRETAPGA